VISPKEGFDIQGPGDGSISLKLTVPFACPQNDVCALTVHSYIPEKADFCQISSLKVVGDGAAVCGIQFTNDDVGRTKHISLSVIAGDNANANIVISPFAVFLQIIRPSHPFMHGNLLETVRVSINVFLFYKYFFAF